MKITYRKKVMTEIEEAIHEAAERNEEIDMIELTDSEWVRLLKELPALNTTTNRRPPWGEIRLKGITICREAPCEGGF